MSIIVRHFYITVTLKGSLWQYLMKRPHYMYECETSKQMSKMVMINKKILWQRKLGAFDIEYVEQEYQKN